ncbi:unnamed protein product, partial [Chrysoparadoxa australica]
MLGQPAPRSLHPKSSQPHSQEMQAQEKGASDDSWWEEKSVLQQVYHRGFQGFAGFFLNHHRIQETYLRYEASKDPVRKRVMVEEPWGAFKMFLELQDLKRKEPANR